MTFAHSSLIVAVLLTKVKIAVAARTRLREVLIEAWILETVIEARKFYDRLLQSCKSRGRALRTS
jgi:hypothetical protein